MPEWQISNEAAWPVATLPRNVTLLARREVLRDGQTRPNGMGYVRPFCRSASRVRAVVDYVHNQVTFGYGFAHPPVLMEALDERVGVCRDFAHTTIALCRALNIPARYVNGYLGDIGVRKILRPWILVPGWKFFFMADGILLTPAITTRAPDVW